MKNTRIPASSHFQEWESEVIELLSSELGLSYGDASGIIEANEFYVNNAWIAGWDAEETAKKLLSKSFK